MKLQSEFLLLETYKKHFDVSDRTIFAYDNEIYSNYPLPDHLITHENTHLKQQEKYGLDTWVEYYLEDKDFRLKMEIEAYRNQLLSIKDKNQRNTLRLQVAKDLSSSTYGNICTNEEAFKLLKI